jgi:ubiquinol-cytochrome c reductase cytochrome b subunit
MTKSYILSFISSHIIFYPTPVSISFGWSFGSLAGVTLVIQIMSGVLLSMYYTPNINLAFYSVEFIMRDVPNGWLIRYIHANGASMFFIVVYGHMCRGLYYGSYMKPRQLLWCSGVVILLLMMATAFTGYVLPWGQMSLWGATVITRMVTVIPLVGIYIVEWLWGGYTVSKPTLYRFYTVHFLLPFLIVGMTLLHLALLHKIGSSNSISSDTNLDDVPFYPYMLSKDLFAFSVYLFVFAVFVFYFPNVLNHPDNCIPANPMKTPAHVVPEWYFLPYYAILRSIPTKVSGILGMFGSLLVLFSIPFTSNSEIRNTSYRPLFQIFFWFFIIDFCFLIWVGQQPVKDAYYLTGQIATICYFFFFFFAIPFIGPLEMFLVNYKKKINNKLKNK